MSHAPFRAVLALAAALLVPFLAAPAGAAEKTVRVSLVLFADIDDMSERNGRGGFARLAAAVKAERARAPNVLVVHAGDTISPSLMSGFDQGAHVIALLNRIRPDVFVPGNHEYDFGESVFRLRMGEARFPLLAANLRDGDGKPLPGFADWRLFDFDGVKIGVVGLTEEKSASISSPGTLRFASSLETVARAGDELRKAGADIVVVAAHSGRKRDMRLRRSGKIDVLLSGHDHLLIVEYDGKTAQLESKAQGEFVTVVELEVAVRDDAGARRVAWRPRFRIVDTADVTPDAQVAARVADYQKALSAELDVPIGRTAVKLDSRRASVRTRETAIGNLMADAARESVKADIGLLNGGGIRGDRLYAAGTEITRRDVLSELPFRNTVVLVEMTGKDLLRALENCVWYAGKPNGRFCQLAGVRLEARLDAVPGAKITSAAVAGAAVDPEKSYTVATTDFIARGSEGFDAFKGAKVIVGPQYGTLLANAVMAHVRKQGTVAPRVEGRIVLR